MFLALLGSACAGPVEPTRVELPVVVDPSGLSAVTTDLGYEVELSSARMVFENLRFTIAGEVHSRKPLLPFGRSIARAHPGHLQAGTVTGELRGRFVADFRAKSGEPLGDATLLVGRYRGANFTFARAEERDGLEVDDPLLGHTARLEGTARRNGDSLAFVVVLDAPPARELVGAPCEIDVTETSSTPLAFRLLVLDPIENDTLFDGIDFLALPREGGVLHLDVASESSTLASAAQMIRRRFLTHDHFDVKASP